jgi:hypothetical protein
MIRVDEREFEISLAADPSDLFGHLVREIERHTGEDEIPVRFAITSTVPGRGWCEIGLLSPRHPVAPSPSRPLSLLPPPLFDFRRRPHENTSAFNAVMLVPTGIGCEIGGHAGDAGPAARLLATVCDRLILHPNVVNGSDLNEMPENALYVEGSVICRLLQGTIGLQPVRANRVLVVIDGDREDTITEAVINAVNAAHAVYGFACPKIVAVDPPVRLRSVYTASGRAAGCVEGLERLLTVLEQERGRFDAVALSGVIHLPFHLYMEYLRSDGNMVNPLGGVEAIYTHTLSLLTDLPSAHAPMYASPETVEELSELQPTNPGIVDPRMAAEVISMTFLQSVLKGLQRSPRIIPDPVGSRQYAVGSGEDPSLLPTAYCLLPTHAVLTAADVACLVIPEGVLGLPVLAALAQGIPVIAVRENRNRMRNDLSLLPWAEGQYLVVENYLEAVGALAALKSGLSLKSLRRPLKRVETVARGVVAQKV